MSEVLPDIVVPVRQEPTNTQLRYALRSWSAHLPHRQVWIVGYRPAWLHGVRHIPVPQSGTKYANTTAAVRAACEHPEVTDTFLLCNDDFFVMRPVERMPVLHRGLVRDVEEHYTARGHNGRYVRGMRETRQFLTGLGHDEPLSYELHVPLPVTKAGMLYALDAGAGLDVLHKRTAYGVLNGIGGDRIDDVKVLTRHRFPRDSQFLSTLPDTFANGVVGRHIRAAFPKKCRYEKPGRWR
ncbi:hypothetical protein DIZ27_32845 [Streptomyces sp. NWU339]|uniref:hypothetical protein n=1 Tax=Streptomyces sp. NWU339 TaxID=2185284 RepID=UPI000D67CD24|nr:hypothetical protein [Streptomyces sp. NWU339]PWI06530.1 hypothetical protein DIZ27_32845 [Streptomyces sp. NWU339]